MRNKKEFRDEILVRYNREKRRREIRRKNLSAAACSLCMVFVILLSGSVYLSAAFGASLFADVDASFDYIFNAVGNNKAEDAEPSPDNEPSKENEDQIKNESDAPEGGNPHETRYDQAIPSETMLPEENVNSDKVSTDSVNESPQPVETTPETEAPPKQLPETTNAPEATMKPDWTKASETTIAPELTKAPETPMVPETTKKHADPTTDNEISPSPDEETSVSAAENGGDGAAFWRVLIIGSAAVCLIIACVFVFKAVKKDGRHH